MANKRKAGKRVNGDNPFIPSDRAAFEVGASGRPRALIEIAESFGEYASMMFAGGKK